MQSGTYAVTYSATDVAGNNSIITHTYQVDAVASYPGCDTPDITIGAYTISACNVGTNTAGLTAASYGGYFQFGRNTAYPTWANGTAGNQSDWKTPGGIDNGSANDWGVQEVNNTTATYANVSAADKVKMQGPCATGYHVPTNAEWVGIHTAGLWLLNGTNMLNALKMPMTGYRSWVNVTLYYQGTFGYYWSSSPNGTLGYYMYFYSANIDPSYYLPRAYGISVRCFKN